MKNKAMRVGKNELTDEGELYLDSEECAMLKDIIRGSHLPQKRKFQKVLEEL
jgi:hypothetical protein